MYRLILLMRDLGGSPEGERRSERGMVACTLTGAVDIILGSKSVSPQTDSAVAVVGMDAGGMYIALSRSPLKEEMRHIGIYEGYT